MLLLDHVARVRRRLEEGLLKLPVPLRISFRLGSLVGAETPRQLDRPLPCILGLACGRPGSAHGDHGSFLARACAKRARVRAVDPGAAATKCGHTAVKEVASECMPSHQVDAANCFPKPHKLPACRSSAPSALMGDAHVLFARQARGGRIRCASTSPCCWQQQRLSPSEPPHSYSSSSTQA